MLYNSVVCLNQTTQLRVVCEMNIVLYKYLNICNKWIAFLSPNIALAFVMGIHRWPVNSPHKGPVTRKMFPFDDVIISEVIWHSRENNFTAKVQPTLLYNDFENHTHKNYSHFSRKIGKWVNWILRLCHASPSPSLNLPFLPSFTAYQHGLTL